MTRLLESLALVSILRYPVRVRHTTEQVPDFQLTTGDRRIAVELTRVKFQDVEHGRSIQETEVKRTLSISSLAPKPGGPRKKREVIEDGFGTPVMLFPSSVDDDERVWLQQAKESLDAKTEVLARNDFVRGDENWLLLLNPVGAALPNAQTRKDNFAVLLTQFWRDKWFNRVFLQDTYFRWQMAFTPSESTMLPALVGPIIQFD